MARASFTTHRGVLPALVGLAFLILPAARSVAAEPVIVEAENRSQYMRGVPVPPERIVPDDLSWARDFERVLWANQNVHMVLDIDVISRGVSPVVTIPYAEQDLKDIPFEGPQGMIAPLSDVLLETNTDGFIVLQNGQILSELYFNGFRPDKRHQMNSATKSFIGMLVGILADEGVLDLAQPFAESFGELRDSGVADATLNAALDMAVGVDWPMGWEDPQSYRHLNFMAGGFYQRSENFPYNNTLELIATADKNRPHGERYFYASVNTELLGWSISRAVGRNWQELLSERIWSKLGAERDAFVIIDPAGHGFATAGMSATLRDLARAGLMIENNGFYNGQQIVPAAWIQDTIRGNAQVRAAMQGSPELSAFPGMFYNNQFRVLDSDAGEIVALGGIGQMIYVNQQHDLVAVFLSTSFDSADAPNRISLMRQIRDHLMN